MARLNNASRLGRPEHGYVFVGANGIKHTNNSGRWCRSQGEQPGEVIVEVSQRSSKIGCARSWSEPTVDLFSMLKQLSRPIQRPHGDPWADFKTDPIWERSAFEDLVLLVMRELAKSNPRCSCAGNVCAVNLIRRVPPAPLFTLLETSPSSNMSAIYTSA